MAVLTVRDLTVAFPAKDGPKTVLQDVSFELNRGEILGLVGESGSGKSITGYTITKLLHDKAPAAQLLSGEVIFDGKDILKISEHEMRKRYRGKRISTILQDAKGAFSPVTPVGPQIAEMFRLHRGMGRKEAKAATVQLLADASISEPRQAYGKTIDQLSGGEAQRANIAMMALATKPDVLIADEATTALDVTVQAQTLDYLLRVVRENDISLILITHDFGLIAEYADSVVVLDRGSVVEKGPVSEVFLSPRSEFVRNILKDLPRMDKMLKSPRLHSSFVERAVEARNVSVRFPAPKEGLFERASHQTAVENASFSLGKGEILGIVGESGSGKTTLMRAALNVLPEDASLEGKIEVSGTDIYSLSEKDLRKLRRSMGGVPQGSRQSLTPRVRVHELIGEGLMVHGLLGGEIASQRERQRKEKVLELLDLVELPPEETFYKFPSQLSGGEQQRVATARALAVNPDILFLDEPTASLDASRKNTILKLLLKLHDERKLSLVLISHELHVIASICDQVAVMWKGRIVETGSPQDIFGNPAHPYTQILVSSVPIPDPAKAREKRKARETSSIRMPVFSRNDLAGLGPSQLRPVDGNPNHFVDTVSKTLFLAQSV